MTKEDLRVMRTRMTINQVFIELVKEKGFENVSVKDIAEAAMINRSTFYSHYKDKFDLMQQLLMKALEAMSTSESGNLLKEDNKIYVKEITDTITRMLLMVQEEKDFYFSLIQSVDWRILKDTLWESVVKNYKDILDRLTIKESDLEIPIEVVANYSISIVMNLLNWWLSDDNDMTAAQLAHLMVKMIGNANLTVLGVDIVF
ncbi:TetR/AcrR family transcriptional regulator [Fundicoccus culcitae]|uniref:TetR/AcrR family transcriptional regulator n=1 Tax=Fundicoccus culcitae TaxID=2969821 RepID=A0ABY5P3U1_9LACT|nr:TetR/AcrR family transcriptional regulator [Fundicoccus culcitae]UUX33392.1 TetR/AcrR family transcriptional regulator [Fundicoccus culcitae]